MTYKELSDAILALPDAQQQEPAQVWPPEGCPAAEGVPVVGLTEYDPPRRKSVVFISTGKKPV